MNRHTTVALAMLAATTLGMTASPARQGRGCCQSTESIRRNVAKRRAAKAAVGNTAKRVSRLKELEEGVRVLAEEYEKMNHHASVGDYFNGVSDPTGTTDEGEVRHVRFMEESYTRVLSNPTAKAAIEAAGKEQG